MVTAVDLANETQRRAARPDTSVWVTASAGSGKTKVLTDRLVNLLLSGALPERILCLTFTKAAATEMSVRVNGLLGEWATMPPDELTEELRPFLGDEPADGDLALARQLFARVLDVPGGMKIMTIHAFCQSVLRRFPVEAGIAPHFEVMDERDAAESLARALAEMLARARTGDPALATAVADVTSRIHEIRFPNLVAGITDARGKLAQWGRRPGDDPIARLWQTLGVPTGTRPDDVIAAACADGAFDGPALRNAAEALAQGGGADDKRAKAIADWLAADSVQRADTFDGYAGVFLTQKEEPRRSLHTKAALSAWPGLAAAMIAEQQRLLATVELRRKATVGTASAALLTLAYALLRSYESDKAARALLDYDDLILRTRDLLARPGVAAWVLFKLDGGLDHILIDEGQDTNPEQWQIVADLAEEFFVGQTAGDDARPLARTVFALGDAKQSIFRFQRADPKAFAAMRAHFRQRVEGSHHAWREVPMYVSFRSAGAVLQAIDQVFAQPQASDGVVDPGEVMEHLSAREGDGGSVEIWPALTPQSPPAPEPWKPPIDRVPTDDPRRRLAALVAERIRAWLAEGERLDAYGRTVAPGDILVLVRRRDAFVEALVRELKDRNVAVAGVDRMRLTEQLAVMDLVALGSFLLLPEDDLTLATVLKCPLIGLDETALFDLAHARSGTLWRALQERQDAPFTSARQYLADLLGRADFVRPFELFAEVLNQGGRRRLLARLGPDAEDAIDEFLSLALHYERTNAPSLQGFIHWLAAGEAEIKRDLEHGGDAVRVMTVHGAKGLEAPIVILPDTLQLPPPPRSPLLWPDGADTVLWPPRAAERDAVCEAIHQAAKRAELQEYRRLLYVAMTRAADRLIVCGWRSRNQSSEPCWYDLVRDGLASIAEEVEDAFLANASQAEGATVLRVKTPQMRPPPAPEAPAAAAPIPLPAWAREQPASERQQPRPLAPSHPDADEPPARSPFDGDDHYARGRLIHRLLQYLPEAPSDGREAACRRYLARAADNLSDEARDEVAASVLAVLRDPRFAAIFGPGSRAEVPVAGLTAGGQIVSGQVDRLLVSEDEVWIVDYKSHRTPPADADAVPVAYMRQMAAYRALLRRIYDEKAIRCALLWTEAPALMELAAQALDAHEPRDRAAVDGLGPAS